MSIIQSTLLFARIGLRNALKYRRRSIETGLIILISALVLTALGGFISGFIQNYMDFLLENTAHAKIFHKGYYQKQEISPLELVIDDYPRVIEEIRKVDPTVTVSPSVSAGAVVSSGEDSLNMLCQGIEPYAGDGPAVFPSYREYRDSIVAGHFFADNAEQGILVSSYVAATLGSAAGDSLIVFTSDSYGSFNAVELPVIGVFRTGDKNRDEGICLVDLAAMQRLVGLENRTTEIALLFADIAAADTFSQRIGGILRKYELEYYSWKQLLGGMLYALDAGMTFQYIIYLIFLIITAVGIMNTVLLSVFDRIRDIGTLRAIGFTRNDVTFMILFELLFVGIVAALIGTLLGGGIIYYFSVHGIGFSEASRELAAGYRLTDRIYPAFRFIYLLIPFVVSATVPLVAALYPLFIMRRMKVKEALGHV